MTVRGTIFFGAGPGRCGTMALSKMLNLEHRVVCTHEGNVHKGLDWDLKGQKQLLPYLTLENYQAYSHPENASEIFLSKRSVMKKIIQDKDLLAMGDIAYNNAPFVSVIPKLFPNSKLIILIRDGRDFVRSVYTNERPDPTPVGWLDNDTSRTPLESYISWGRLRPTKDRMAEEAWNKFDALEKNAWLWSETIGLILDGAKMWQDENVYILRFEDFVKDTKTEYSKIRDFLGISNNKVPNDICPYFNTPVNKREDGNKVLPHWKDWTPEQQDKFNAIAGDMMKKLNYFE